MTQPDRTFKGWTPWELAVKYVERHRGCSYGQAAKAVDDACASGILKHEPRPDDPQYDEYYQGPFVWSPDLWRWLGNAKPKSLPKKRIKIKLLLAEIFHGQPVPDEYSRNELRADLLKRDKSLNPLHFDTLKSAIDEYNAERT